MSHGLAPICQGTLGIAFGSFAEALVGLLVLKRVQQRDTHLDVWLGFRGATCWEIDLAQLSDRAAVSRRVVATRLGNTPTICRKCYVHPAVLESYAEGTLRLRRVAAKERTRGRSNYKITAIP